MRARSSLRVSVLASVATLLMVCSAQAQTAEECTAAVADANAAIDDPASSNTPAKNQAQVLSVQASDAGDQGRFADCIDLATQAKAAVTNK